MINDFRLIKGSRQSSFKVLTEFEIKSLLAEIMEIEADTSIFIFNYDRAKGTGYIDEKDIIAVKGDIFPSNIDKVTHPRSIMSSRAVLAHEYYGHRIYRGTLDQVNSWQDEYRASRTAAEITPNLTDEERRHLIMDALERKREAGIVPVLDDFEKKILYGDIKKWQ